MVRETVGVVAYMAGQWTEALTELRAARRMAGGPGLVAVMADCERALGKPEKALELARSEEAAQLDPASSAELAIVAAGARADLGQHDAALVSLKAAATGVNPAAEYAFRLFYAYAAMLLETGAEDEAVNWFIKAADADFDGETDAAQRAAALTGYAAQTVGHLPVAADDDSAAGDPANEEASGQGQADDTADAADGDTATEDQDR